LNNNKKITKESLHNLSIVAIINGFIYVVICVIFL